MLQRGTHEPFTQLEVPFTGGVQSASMQHALVAMHAPLQSLKPVSHRKPQLTPSQVAVAFAGGVGHALQRAPQLAVLVSSAQVPVQSWKPVLQLSPHEPFVQLAVAFARAVQSLAVQHAVLAMHAPAQTLKPELQDGEQVPPSQNVEPFTGALQSGFEQHAVDAMQPVPQLW